MYMHWHEQHKQANAHFVLSLGGSCTISPKATFSSPLNVLNPLSKQETESEEQTENGEIRKKSLYKVRPAERQPQEHSVVEQRAGETDRETDTTTHAKQYSVFFDCIFPSAINFFIRFALRSCSFSFLPCKINQGRRGAGHCACDKLGAFQC